MSSRSTFARRALSMASVSLALLVTACASTPPPLAEMATARTSVASAESAGALQQAPTEFLMARDKLARAEALSKDKNYTDARRMAEEATADANVAERKSRAAVAAKTADELRRANGVLADELNRSGQK